MNKKTDELYKIIEKQKNPESYFKENMDEFLKENTISNYLNILLSQKHLSTSKGIALSQISKDYGHQIFNGHKKNPSRNKLLAICVGLKLSRQECKILLSLGGHADLYPRIPRDAVILSALSAGYSVMETNELLYARNMELLG